MLLLLLFYFLLCVLKVNVGDGFTIASRDHDSKLCEHVAGCKRLDHLTRVLLFKKKKQPNTFV